MSRRRSSRRSLGTLQRRRVLLLALLGCSGYALLTARAVQLQALDAEWLAARAHSQHRGTLRLGPLRGPIRDRHGSLLAASADVESVAVSPRRVRDRARVARELARVLGLDARQLERRLSSRRGFVWIKRWVAPDQADRVRQLALPGVSLHAERKRFYPSRGLAASYVGFAGRDGQGLTGLELAFDAVLRGAPTSIPFRKDARGVKLIDWEGDLGARSGATLTLTLDARLQNFAESLLERTLERTRARQATLVALDPRNGDLLTLAERPSFNPNRFWIEEAGAFRAHAFTNPFEPGSTLKPFVVALALEAGVTTPSDRFDCENGSWRVRDRVIHDFKPHGVLSVRDIVRLSSNIGAAKVAERLGSRRLVRGLHRLGFGETSGSGFPGESAGLLRDLRDSQAVERANLSFGQGLSVTAVQLAAAGAVLANGGRGVRPRLVLRLEGTSGRIDWPSGLGERRLSRETARIVREMMREVVASGTGRLAALPHHAVAGKTGTSQKVINGRYSREHFVASFLGMLPARRPQLVVVVVVDEPHGSYTGGAVAAPLFREFAAFAAEQLALPRGDAT
ncbi:MAG: peptidoglycan D,D-transpeptidase FtsI family protein [Myxococcota bacterium]